MIAYVINYGVSVDDATLASSLREDLQIIVNSREKTEQPQSNVVCGDDLSDPSKKRVEFAAGYALESDMTATKADIDALVESAPYVGHCSNIRAMKHPCDSTGATQCVEEAF